MIAENGSNYSFKPRPLRGSACAVSCTTPPSRYASRLNSGVRRHRNFISSSQSYDRLSALQLPLPSALIIYGCLCTTQALPNMKLLQVLLGSLLSSMFAFFFALIAVSLLARLGHGQGAAGSALGMSMAFLVCFAVVFLATWLAGTVASARIVFRKERTGAA